MKLFGNTGTRARARSSAPPKRRSRNTGSAAVAVERRGNRFRRGYLIYVLCMLLIIAGGLALLWRRMDVYEQSRPARAMERWFASSESLGWKNLLKQQGIDEAFLDTLDLSAVDCYKRLDTPAGGAPEYGVRFGGKTVLNLLLKEGERLPFGSCRWEVDSVTLADVGLRVYVPQDAVVYVDGAPTGDAYPVRHDAKPLALGVFEQNREDIPGLTEYFLKGVFSIGRVGVCDAEGAALIPGHSTGDAFYFPPLTKEYFVLAPAAASVEVNGVPLTAENAEQTILPSDDVTDKVFRGIEDSLPFIWASHDRCYWRVDGLVAQPIVTAALQDGTELAEEREGNTSEFRWSGKGTEDPALAEELESFILNVFDAQIAYLGNRNGAFENNYARYIAYVMPDSEAYDQAYRSRESVVWAKGRNTHPEPSLGEVLRYDEDCFTAQVDYIPEGEEAEATQSNIYVFVRYNGSWRVVRTMSL